MVKENESEKVIRRLYQITSNYQCGFEVQMSQLLKMGLERFDLDIGILSCIEGDVYTVLHCETPEGAELNPGDTFNLESTYCQITCSALEPIAIENMGKNDKYAFHPAYKAFGLESYIGIPILVEGVLFGTLNFSSAKAYPRKFKAIDIDALKLMASWIEVEVIRRKQEQRLLELNEYLEYQAHHDPLTKVANRRRLFKTLNLEMEQLNRNSGQGSLLVIDIDNFKRVNDTYGHQIGDDVLKKTANQLKLVLSENDFIARMGGEEFVVWLPERSLPRRRALVEQLHRAVNEIVLGGEPITVSIGVCELDLTHSLAESYNKSLLDQSLAMADRALYGAKDEGRNLVRYESLGIEAAMQ